MASINVLSCTVVNPTAKFSDAFSFDITFDCLAELSSDLEWKVTYVGSATSRDYDQVLDSVLVGPVMLGTNRFVLDVPAPDIKKVPSDDILGATIVLVSCSYNEKEFIRIGFWVANFYDEELPEGVEPPKPIPAEKIKRVISSEQPHVTRWPIEWQ